MTITNKNQSKKKENNNRKVHMSIKESFEKAAVRAGYTSVKQYKSTLINVIKD